MGSSLIPCPFCGNSGSLSPVWEGPFDWADGIWTGQMHCEKCGAKGPIVHFMEQYEVEEKTSVAWNERHESNELQEWAKIAIEKIVMDANKRKHGGAANVSPCERYGLVLLGKILSLRREKNDRFLDFS